MARKEKTGKRNRMKSKSQETKDVLRKNIKKIRTEKEMSQDLLGLMVGVSKQNVSNWELGKKIVSVERLRELAEVLDVPADQLLGTDSGRVYCRRCGNWFVPMTGKNIDGLYYCPYCGDKNFVKEKKQY